MNEKKREYVIQYWVGLMDGDGSVQVNHWKSKVLQYRLVIKLKNDSEKRNTHLLERIQKSIGGCVKVENSQKNVIWVENHKKKICEIIYHFEKYPPLTSRLSFQLHFYKECMKKQDINWYLQNRLQKYNKQANPSILPIPFYNQRNGYKPYKGWLSGFIEALGCFNLRSGSFKYPSFSISKKGEPVLLQQISQFFGGKTKGRLVVNSKQKKKLYPFKEKRYNLFVENKYHQEGLYILEIYNKDVLKKLVSHCTLYPLYGEKNKIFLLFSKSFIKDNKCRVVLPLWE